MSVLPLTIKGLSKTFLLLSIFLLGLTICYGANLLSVIIIVVYFSLSLYRRNRLNLYCAILFLIIMLEPYVLPAKLLSIPPIYLLLPFLLSTSIMLLITDKKILLPWLRAGNLDKITVSITVISVLIVATGLYFWALSTNDFGIGKTIVDNLNYLPIWAFVIILIPMFSLINAFTEEVVFRGVIQTALIETFNSAWSAILIQAILFGFVHYKSGFPNGVLGCSMAFSFGVVTGYLRFATKGIFASCIIHIFADLTIGYLLVWPPHTLG